MNILLSIFIFCIVLFIYLHIQFHLKTSDDLEIYEIEQITKEKLEEILDLRQPVLFYFDNKNILETVNKTTIFKNYESFDVKIRNIHDISGEKENTELYVPLSIKVTDTLLKQDNASCYFSENNNDLLQETGLIKKLKFNDIFLRPAMVSNCYYDIMFGSKNTYTPFRYELNYRNFFLVTEGSVKIKVSPPHNKKHLYSVCDYENLEFRSPINPWNPQPKYSIDFDKVKCIEVVLKVGQLIFLPAYWWYSICFIEQETCISCFRYRTYMNNFAILPEIGLHLLQMHNIKKTVEGSLTNQTNQTCETEPTVNHEVGTTNIDTTTDIDTATDNITGTTDIDTINIPNLDNLTPTTLEVFKEDIRENSIVS